MGATVLVVEDDLSILHLFQDIVRSEGFEAVGVAEPNEALPAAIRYQPSLILIDVMLPRTSGIEVAEELRANGFAHTPMIALSASTIMRELAMHTGLFQATMAKPFEIERLCNLIHALVATRDYGIERLSR